MKAISIEKNIGERIDVLAKFTKTEGLRPISFKRGKCHYPIDQVTLQYSSPTGRDRKRHYCVTSGNEFFILVYYNEKFYWEIEEYSDHRGQ